MLASPKWRETVSLPFSSFALFFLHYPKPSGESPWLLALRAVDELISSVPYLAAKTLETHLLLLSPVFGKEAVLGTSAPSLRLARAGSALSAGYAGLGSEEAPGARKVSLLQLFFSFS